MNHKKAQVRLKVWGVPAFIVLIVLLLFPANSYNDPDTFWHIENGRYMIEHHSVLHHAIHTFYGNQLPYIPHEFGFELIEATLYAVFGWPGTYLLTALCYGLLMIGLYRLMEVSRQELGLTEMPFVCTLFLAPVGLWIYYNYFTSRPQMVSAFLIVWYFIWMRKFKMTGKYRYGAAMVLFSFAIANFHAGVWPLIAVFSGMQIAETLWQRSGKLNHVYVYVATALAALLNPGGWHSLTYVLIVTQHHYNLLIDEWKPLNFWDWENIPIILMLLFFVYILPFSLRKKAFRIMLMVGIGYLGVTNFKQNLFLWLFVPYFAAAAMDKAPLLRTIAKFRFSFHPRTAALALAAGLALNVAFVFANPPEVNAKIYPVDEMNYVLAHSDLGTRPRVLTRYGASGYVMYRGGDVLCDGRQDPFITDASKGIFGWNAFERSMYGFSDKLPQIVKADRPDYVIAQNNISAVLQKQWEDAFGKPVYSGRYGKVYDIKGRHTV